MRIIHFAIMNTGSHAKEGELAVRPGAVIAVEPFALWGGPFTWITLQGGRRVAVNGTRDEILEALDLLEMGR